jgi:heme-degrading monooxygenase HmoA
MTKKQWAIIGALALAVICELSALGALVVWDSSQQTATVVQIVETSPALFTETLTPTATLPPTITPQPPTPTSTRVFTREEINEPTLAGIADEVIAWRELQPIAGVDFQLLTLAELKERFAQYYAEESTPEDIEKMRQAYVTLGLLDEDFDLATTLVDMQAESIAGFYTPSEKRLYIISEYELVETEQKITFAHEYTHALQDQHFDLARLIDVEDNSDRALAARALAEGDATLLMAVYAYENVTQAEWDWLAYQASRLEEEKVEIAPQALGKVSLFPYTYGTQFVLGLFLEGGPEVGWAAVNQAYSDPPQSTEQVMHLDKYINRDEPQLVELPDLAAVLSEGWEQLDRDVMGELVTMLYLGEQLDEEQAAKAAEGWDGDAYVILRNSQGQRLLVVHSVWDSAAEAQEFSAAFSDYVAQKYEGPLTPSAEKATRKWCDTPTVSVLSSQHDQETLIVVAPDRGSTEKVLAQFSDF